MDFGSIILWVGPGTHILKNFLGKLNLWPIHTIIYDACAKKNDELYARIRANLQDILCEKCKSVYHLLQVLLKRRINVHICLYMHEISLESYTKS